MSEPERPKWAFVVLTTVLVAALALVSLRMRASDPDSPGQIEREPPEDLSAIPSPHRLTEDALRTSALPSWSVLALGPEDEPLAGVRCTLIAPGIRWLAKEDAVPLGQTGEEGRLVVKTASPWAPARLLAERPGFVSTVTSLTGGDIVVRLARSVPLVIECVDVDMTALENAHVFVSLAPFSESAVASAMDSGELRPSLAGARGVLSGRTGPDGRIVVHGLRTGVALIRAVSSGKTVKGNTVTAVDVPTNKPVRLEFADIVAAGLAIVGDGEVLGKFATAHAVVRCSDRHEIKRAREDLEKRHPNASLIVTALSETAPSSALLSCWHTRAGWVSKNVPLTRISEFRPEEVIAPPQAPVLPPAEILLRVEDRTGQPADLDELYIQTGPAYGVRAGQSGSDTADDLGKSLKTKLTPGVPCRLPPGTYRFHHPQAAVRQALGAVHGPVVLRPGERLEHTLRFTSDLRRVLVKIKAPNPDWGFGTISIRNDQGRLVYQSGVDQGAASAVWLPRGQIVSAEARVLGFKPATIRIDDAVTSKAVVEIELESMQAP